MVKRVEAGSATSTAKRETRVKRMYREITDCARKKKIIKKEKKKRALKEGLIPLFNENINTDARARERVRGRIYATGRALLFPSAVCAKRCLNSSRVYASRHPLDPRACRFPLPSPPPITDPPRDGTKKNAWKTTGSVIDFDYLYRRDYNEDGGEGHAFPLCISLCLPLFPKIPNSSIIYMARWKRRVR